MKLKKTSLSLPPELINDLDYVAGRMGVSRSALLTNIAQEPIADLRNMVEAIPSNPTKSDILRSRGASKKIIENRMEQLKQLEDGDDLFA